MFNPLSYSEKMTNCQTIFLTVYATMQNPNLHFFKNQNNALWSVVTFRNKIYSGCE